MKDTKMFIIGVLKLIIKVDAKYIKGMLNNPDIIPNAAANQMDRLYPSIRLHVMTCTSKRPYSSRWTFEKTNSPRRS